MWLRAVGLGIALLLPGACAGLTSPPFTAPESGGPAWTKFTSEHFVIRTDLAADDGLAVAQEFERIYATLADVAFPFAAKPHGRTSVLVLRNQAEYEAIAPIGSAGFFRGGSDDFDNFPSLFVYGSLSEQARTLVLHELTHRFVAFYFPSAPRWLNEGLASYYETAVIEDGKLVLGRPRPDRLFRTGKSWAVRPIPGGRLLFVPTDAVPTVPELLASTPADFSRRTDEPGLKEEDALRVQASYAGAWALVHMLKSSPEPYPIGLEAFMLAIGANDEPGHAWSEAFQGVPTAQIAADFQTYLRRREWTVLRTQYQPPEPAIEKREAMTPADVHLLWAAIRPPDRLRTEVAAANLHAPGTPDVALWRGRLAMREGKAAEAEKFLREAIAARPDEERYLLELFKYINPDEATPTPEQIAALDALVPAMLRIGKSADACNSLAWYLMHRGKLEEALPLALTAVRADLSCWACLDTLAAVYFARGDFEEAFVSQTMAVNGIPDGYVATGALARWDKYRAARAQARP